MINEIREIPEKARLCFEKNRTIRLPEEVPYIGMGSSYFAPLALKYAGCNIFPEIASEYYHYSHRNKDYALAVLLSQSGCSSETVWNIERFSQYLAIVNNTDSPLATSPKASQVIEIHAGAEEHSSTKTYVNTLITLYQGLGIDTQKAVRFLEDNIQKYEEWGERQAEFISDKYKSGNINGIYVLGNGPNIATACEAALVLTECTKIPFIPMALPQYDHGSKESAHGSIVIGISTEGPLKHRTRQLFETITRAGAISVIWEESDVSEYLSPVASIVPLNCLAYSLARKLGISRTFAIGNKVTLIEKNTGKDGT